MKRFHTLGVAVALIFSAIGVAHAQLKLGLAGPFTGSIAALGALEKIGVEQAVADINARGGILGQKIILYYGDDAADPRQGVSAANKLVGQGIRFVVGPLNSGVTMAASEVYNENGVLQITPVATNPKITDRGMWNLFRTCGRDDQQGLVAGRYIVSHFRQKRVAIIHDKTTYGQGLAGETRKEMRALGVTEVLYAGVNAGEKDYSALIAKIKVARADLVYWGGLYPEAGLIVRQMRDQGVMAVLMGGDGIASEEFASIGGPAAEGTLMTYAPDPRKRAEAKAVVERLRAGGFEPESYTLYSYAAVEVIKQAAEAATSLDPRKVAAEISSGRKFRTVIGELSYDTKGDITRLDYVVYVWHKGPSGRMIYTEVP